MEFQTISAIIWKQPHIYLSDHIIYNLLHYKISGLNMHEHDMIK